MRLAGAVALVTGASSGIGAATADALSAAGANLVLSGRDRDRLNDVAKRTSATPVYGDLADPDGPDRVAEAALAAAGQVDLLVSNAGTGWAGPLGELTATKAAEMVALNLLAPIQLARLLAPAMAARGYGRLIFVSSFAGATGVRHEAAYAATKGGLNILAESLSYELAQSGVGVSLVMPGVVDTAFYGSRGLAYSRRWPAPIRADRVGRAIADAAIHDRAVVYVPRWMWFPAWTHGAIPGVYRRLAARFG